MLLTICLAACPLSGTGEGILCMPCFACWSWERVASWLVGAGSERQVIAVVCGSGNGHVLIELWFLFVWLDTLCGEGGGPSTVVARDCCAWGSSVQNMLPCTVRFLGRAFDSVH